jgi:hypothetical protein
LLTAVEEDGSNGQDPFQANVCLGWLYYVQEEHELTVAHLASVDFAEVAAQLSARTTTLSGWTRVCLVKGTYLKGTAAI